MSVRCIAELYGRSLRIRNRLHDGAYLRVREGVPEPVARDDEDREGPVERNRVDLWVARQGVDELAVPERAGDRDHTVHALLAAPEGDDEPAAVAHRLSLRRIRRPVVRRQPPQLPGRDDGGAGVPYVGDPRSGAVEQNSGRCGSPLDAVVDQPLVSVVKCGAKCGLWGCARAKV